MSDHLSTQELINRIETKDRRFRVAQSVFLTLLLMFLSGIVFVQFRTLNTVREQLVSSKATALETSKQSDEQRDLIIRRLDCMVAFLSVEDRTGLTLADIDNCSKAESDNLDEFFKTDNSSQTTP